jgi:HEAT repeat protein
MKSAYFRGVILAAVCSSASAMQTDASNHAEVTKLLKEYGCSTAARRVEIVTLLHKIRPSARDLESELAKKVWSVRTVCATLLGTFGDERSIEPLSVALRDVRGEMRWRALQSIARLNSAVGTVEARKLLRDKDAMVRAIAVYLLGMNGAEEDWGSLLDSISDPAAIVRATAIDWIKTPLGTKEKMLLRVAFVKAARDPIENVRHAICRRLEHEPGDSSLGILQFLACADTRRAVRAHAVEALDGWYRKNLTRSVGELLD